jgi:hypothetical protein
MRRPYKPSYCVTVRLGLETIARRANPVDRFELAAIRWIQDMKEWHRNIESPKQRSVYQSRKKARQCK